MSKVKKGSYDYEAEACVLGSMLCDDQAARIAIELLGPDDFYVPKHKILFQLFAELVQTHPNLDLLYVRSELDRRGLSERVGGREILGQLIEQTPSAKDIENYAAIVRKRAIERNPKVKQIFPKLNWVESDKQVFNIRFTLLLGNILAIESIFSEAKTLVDPKYFVGMNRIDNAAKKISEQIDAYAKVFDSLREKIRNEIELTERLLVLDEENGQRVKGRSKHDKDHGTSQRSGRLANPGHPGR